MQLPPQMRTTEQSPVPVELSFDRGTLQISTPRHQRIEIAGVEALWDPRTCTFRAPAHQYHSIKRRLLQLGYPVTDLLHQTPPCRNGWTEPSLRPYQTRALRAWGAGGGRGVVVLPTGSGKTILALSVMARVARPTLVLAPTRVLLHQWVDQIERFTGADVGVMGDGCHKVSALTVSTFESAYRHLDRIGDRFQLLVVDEVHHFGDGLRCEALEMCTATWRLGLTATFPQREEAKEKITSLVGPVVFQASVAELSPTHLAPYRRIKVPIRLTPSEQETYARARDTFNRAYGEFRRLGGTERWADFVSAAMASPGGYEAIRAHREMRRIVSCSEAKLAEVARLLERHPAETTFIFTADNAAAYTLSARLLVPAITCHIGQAERGEILAGLRDGRLRTVVSAQVLNEGIDLPEARVGIIMGGVKGGREHVQRVGRLLRPQPGKEALIYELVAHRTHEERHAERRQLFLVA